MTTYQWQRGTPPAPGTGWTNIGGATAQTYTQQTADAGSLLRVVTDVGTSGPVGPVPMPSGAYWIGDFRNGTFSPEYISVFETNSLLPNGYMAADTYDSTGRTLDTSQRVYLTQKLAPPSGATSRWVVRLEHRPTDQPWDGTTTAKSSIRLDTQHTLGPSYPFNYGDIIWWAFHLWLPSNNPTGEYFAPPSGGLWIDFNDFHPAGTPQSVVPSLVVNWRGQDTSWWSYGAGWWLHLTVEGTDNGGPNREIVPFLQTHDANANPIAAAHNRWIKLVWGVKTAVDGTVGARGSGSSSGWVEFYVDNKQVYAKDRPNMRNNEVAPYLTFQNYLPNGATLFGGRSSSVIYQACARAGTTKASVDTVP